MIIEKFRPFSGQHCETTATGTLLHQLGIELSEPLLFGLGEGLSFIYWKISSMDFPFLGGRIKTDLLTKNIAKNLNLRLTVNETSSRKRAWENVKSLIDMGKIVGLKLDCFHLDYFTKPFHFAGHYAAIYGYDNRNAFLIDTTQQGTTVQTSLESLERARAEKGPMSSKNLYYTIQRTDRQFNLPAALLTALKNNAQTYLNPPIKNISHQGILKASSEILRWYASSKNIETAAPSLAVLMEKAGTGGALFRNLYRDFLKESYDLLGISELQKGHAAFTEIATLWTEVSSLFEKLGSGRDENLIRQVAAVLKAIAAEEKKAMQLLSTIAS